MKITYQITEPELYDFNLFRVMRKNSNVVTRAALVACGYLAVMLIMAYYFKFPLYTYFIFVPFSFAIFAGTLFFTRYKMKKSVDNLLLRANKEALMPETTVELTDKLIWVITKSRQSELLYSDVIRVELSKQFLYLELTAYGEVGIPLRAFESSAEAQTFAKAILKGAPKALHIGV